MSNADQFVSTLHLWIDVFMRRSNRDFIHFARESGLSLSQLGALFHLHRHGKTGVTDMGDHLGVTSAAASQMLDRLVQQDLIQRTEDPKDRRVKQIAITEKGCQILEAGIQARQGWLNDLGSVLTDDEQNRIVDALKLLIEKADQLNHSAEQKMNKP